MCPLTPSRKVFRTRRRRRKGPQGPAGPAPLCKRRAAAGDPLPEAAGRPQGRVPGAAHPPRATPAAPRGRGPDPRARAQPGRGRDAGARRPVPLPTPSRTPLGPVLGGRPDLEAAAASPSPAGVRLGRWGKRRYRDPCSRACAHSRRPRPIRSSGKELGQSRRAGRGAAPLQAQAPKRWAPARRARTEAHAAGVPSGFAGSPGALSPVGVHSVVPARRAWPAASLRRPRSLARPALRAPLPPFQGAGLGVRPARGVLSLQGGRGPRGPPSSPSRALVFPGFTAGVFRCGRAAHLTPSLTSVLLFLFYGHCIFPICQARPSCSSVLEQDPNSEGKPASQGPLSAFFTLALTHPN